MFKQSIAVRLVMFFVSFILGSYQSTARQQNILTVYIPPYIRTALPSDLWRAFEEETGFFVQLVNSDYLQFPSHYALQDATEIDNMAYFEDAEKIVTTADIIFLNEIQLDSYFTRTGYLLDISPLITTDTRYTPDDFLPNILEAFAWDEGIWALPVSADIEVLLYDPIAFDELSLSYPNQRWTATDFVQAIQQLTAKDTQTHQVMEPGFNNYFSQDVIYAFTGKPAYDPSQIPYQPEYDEAIAGVLLALSHLVTENYMPSGSFPNVKLPFKLGNFQSMMNNKGHLQYHPALLPENRAASFAHGLAISSGTQYPEAAYQLVQYLAHNPRFIEFMPGDVAAIQHMPDRLSSWLDVIGNQLPPQILDIIQLAEQNMIPHSATLFTNESVDAIPAFVVEEFDLSQMINELIPVEIAVKQALERAANEETTAFIDIGEPQLLSELDEDEILLTFGIRTPANVLPNHAQWDTFIESFVADDPTVGAITLSVGAYDFRTMVQQTDCFYMPAINISNVPTNTDLGILSIEPIIASERAFNPEDYLPETLGYLSRDNMLYVLPLTIQPNVLRFNSSEIPSEITQTMSIDDFVLFLENLGSPSMTTLGPVQSDVIILMFIAAYGGLPIDITTTPVSFHFDDPSTLVAARNIIALIEQGHLEYPPQMTLDNETVLYPESLTPFTQYSDPSSMLLNFPIGSALTPVSYDVGGAAISEGTPHYDACARWIMTLSDHPELFNTMPAKIAFLDDSRFQSLTDENRLTFYHGYVELLNNDNVINLTQETLDGWFLGALIYRAFFSQALQLHLDEDTSLEDALSAAQIKAETFSHCAEPYQNPTIPIDISQEQAIHIFRPIAECAIVADPELQSAFPFLE